MGEPDRAGATLTADRDGFGSSRVGEVAVRARDALLQEVRVRTGVQQVRIVVRLEDQQVEVAELASNAVGHPAEVRRDGGATAAGLHAEAERLAAVVRN